MNRVFVIEDDPLMREVVTRSLTTAGNEVVPFDEASAALDSIVANPPALVISDVHMPRMSGLDLVRAMREQGSRVPVILMSAHVSEAEMDEARALGVVRVFRKPLGEMSRLVMAVESELSGNGAGRLDRVDSLRLEVLTNLSHELRTPLTAARLALDGLVAELEASLNASQKRLATISMRNLDRLITLVEAHLLTVHEQVCVEGEQVRLGERTLTVIPGGVRKPR